MNGALRKVGGYIAASAFLLVGWELLARAIASPALPGPVPAFTQFFALADELWAEAVVSFLRATSAIVIGTVLAVPLGLVVGRSARADAVLGPILFLTYPVPKIVFLPVLMVLLGLENAPKIVLITIVVFFQVLVTARDAAKAVPEGTVLSVRSLGAGRIDIVRHVIFPATLPEIFTALRIGTGTAIAVLFVAESIASASGLGYFIIDAWGLVDYPRMFAGILAMALLGVVIYEALDMLEAWATRWRRTAK